MADRTLLSKFDLARGYLPKDVRTGPIIEVRVETLVVVVLDTVMLIAQAIVESELAELP